MAWSASVLCVLCGRAWGPASWRVGYGQMRVLCGIGEGLRRGARARRRGLCREALVREGTHVRVSAGLRTTLEAGRTCDIGHHQCGVGHPV